MAADADIIFYEKPGCATNARQKKQLREAGFAVEARDLLATPWTPEALLGFFGDAPVADWFNKAAPAVKSGAIDPAALSRAQALDALCAEPILIRRPLIEIKAQKILGFDNALIAALLRQAGQASPTREGCSHAHEDHPPCNAPGPRAP